MIIEKHIHNQYKKKKNNKNNLLKFGNYGFKTQQYGYISQKKLSIINFLISKKLRIITNKKSYKFWCLVLLNQNLTKLSSESRMGKGKGSIYTKSVFTKPGSILFEFDNLEKKDIYYLYNFIKKKVSLKLSLIINK